MVRIYQDANPWAFARRDLAPLRHDAATYQHSGSISSALQSCSVVPPLWLQGALTISKRSNLGQQGVFSDSNRAAKPPGSESSITSYIANATPANYQCGIHFLRTKRAVVFNMTRIYTGVWMNHEYGSLLGATLTLSARDGSLLLSVIAAFVAIAGNRFWRLISYMLHQILASADPKDGVHHQRQVVLRNNASSIGTAWTILQITWFWIKISRRAVLKTVPLGGFAVIFSVGFALATIFSSQVAKGSSTSRLLKSDNCGLWTSGRSDPDSILWRRKYTADVFRATSYSRSCYTSSPSSSECSLLYRPNLPWNSTNDNPCPFDQEMCLDGFTHHMDTGFLDSHLHLGINADRADRVLLRKQTTCAPLPTGQKFTYWVNGTETEALGWPEETILRYMYGPTYGITRILEYTHSYNRYGSNTGNGYSAWGVNSPARRAGDSDNPPWRPIPSLRVVNTTDLVIIFVAPNSVRFDQECNDPVFAFHYDNVTETFEPDRFVSPIACSETYMVCAIDGECSPAMGMGPLYDHILKDPDLNTVQLATVQRLMVYLVWTSMFQTVQTRAANALRAQDTLFGLIQTFLPDDQWRKEVEGWFVDSLARLQHLVTEYAAQPEEYNINGDEVQKPWLGQDDDWSKALEKMCFNQLVNDSQSTMSFSIVGLVLIFTLGGIIIFLSLFVETLVAFIQKKTRWGLVAREAWLQDETIKLQSTMLEQAGIGSWTGHSDTVPTTTAAELLNVWPITARRSFRNSSREESVAFMTSQVHGHPQMVKRKPLPCSQETELYPAPTHRV